MRKPRLGDVKVDTAGTRRLRAQMAGRGKVKITINVDADSLAKLKALSAESGVPYQRLLNSILKERLATADTVHSRLTRVEKALARVQKTLALNVVEFGMNVQEAVEAPRFGSYNLPDSFAPHPYVPGRLAIEERLQANGGEALKAKGHQVHPWPNWTWLAGAVCSIVIDQKTGVVTGGADPRREAYAIGW